MNEVITAQDITKVIPTKASLDGDIVWMEIEIHLQDGTVLIGTDVYDTKEVSEDYWVMTANEELIGLKNQALQAA